MAREDIEFDPPVVEGRIIWPGEKVMFESVDPGSLFLWKPLIIRVSCRQLHVMDETHVINQVKEDVCYVSQQFFKDMEISQWVLRKHINTFPLEAEQRNEERHINRV